MTIAFETGRASVPARSPHLSADTSRATGRWRAVLAYVVAGLVSLVLAAPLLSLAIGFRTLVVTSGSMVPIAHTGDAVVLRRVDPTSIRVGDVITFRPLREGGVRTHRVMSIHHVEGEGLHFRTKGDANNDFDPNLVPAGNVLGRVVTVLPRIGRTWIWATTPIGRLVLVGVPALIIIVRELFWLLAPRRRRTSANVSRPRRRTIRREFATFAIATIAAVAIAGPAAARFTDTAPTGSNTFSSGLLNPPTNLNGSAQLAPCRVNLTWTAPATGLAPTGYDILRSNTSGGPYSLRTHVGAVTSGADATGPLAALTTYYYVVRSTRGGWTSVNSNEKAITTLLCVL